MHALPPLFERALILLFMLRFVFMIRKPLFGFGESGNRDRAFSGGGARVPFGRSAEHELRAFGIKELSVLPVRERDQVIGGQTLRGLFVGSPVEQVRAPAA